MNGYYRKWKHFRLDETLTNSSQNIRTSEQSSSHSSPLCLCLLINFTSTLWTFRAHVCLCFDISSFPPPISKNNYHHFPCNETLCRDQRLWNTHTCHDMTHPTKQRRQICAWCQWHCVSWTNTIHILEKISAPQLYISSEIWKWLKYV